MRHTRLDREDGATAVLVALCLLLLFGAGAIAIDLGSAWQTKRNLVVDTDAAALAGAQALIDGQCADAKTAAAEHLSANLGQSVSVAALESGDPGTVICDAASRKVTVSWTGQAQQTLSGAIGVDSLPVLSSSTARAGLLQPSGLRPLTVCMHDSAITSWISGGAGTQIKLPHEKTFGQGHNSDPSPCGGAPGNWGFTCFDKSRDDDPGTDTIGCGDNNASNNMDDMLRYGYSGDVDLGDGTPSTRDCQPDDPASSLCEQTPGSLGNSVSPGLTFLRDHDVTFPILGIDSYVEGSGQNATTAPSAFLGVKVISFELTGSDKHFVLELVNLFESGTASKISTGNLARREPTVLCAADGVADYC